MEACEFMADMCRLVWLRGGGVMTIDYGSNHSMSNTIRGIRNHKFVNSFINDPGNCDLSAYVDFNLLTHICSSYFGDRLNSHGPISQFMFFEALGIISLWDNIKNNNSLSEAQIENMKFGINKILNKEEMGEI